MPVAGSFAPPLLALAVPGEGRGLLVPGARCLREPGADRGGAVRMLTVAGATLEDALDGRGHVQPAAAERRVERHDAVSTQPGHHLGGLVTGEMVPHQ